jgi:hypothetical protein
MPISPPPEFSSRTAISTDFAACRPKAAGGPLKGAAKPSMTFPDGH